MPGVSIFRHLQGGWWEGRIWGDDDAPGLPPLHLPRREAAREPWPGPVHLRGPDRCPHHRHQARPRHRVRVLPARGRGSDLILGLYLPSHRVVHLKEVTIFSYIRGIVSTFIRHFEIAFKMFDLNGDGNVDADEFDKVTDLMKQHSSTGNKHQDVCPSLLRIIRFLTLSTSKWHATAANLTLH